MISIVGCYQIYTDSRKDPIRIGKCANVWIEEKDMFHFKVNVLSDIEGYIYTIWDTNDRNEAEEVRNKVQAAIDKLTWNCENDMFIGLDKIVNRYRKEAELDEYDVKDLSGDYNDTETYEDEFYD